MFSILESRPRRIGMLQRFNWLLSTTLLLGLSLGCTSWNRPAELDHPFDDSPPEVELPSAAESLDPADRPIEPGEDPLLETPEAPARQSTGLSSEARDIERRLGYK